MKKLLLYSAFSIFGIIVFSFLFFAVNSLPLSSDATPQEFVINQGDSLSSIAARLHGARLIRNPYSFILQAHYLQLDNKLQAGSFRLSPSMSAVEIISLLSSGGSQDSWLKIIEGQRLAELPLDFDPSLEGYLFPDSYLIPDDFTQEEIVDFISKNFDQKFSQAKIDSNDTISDSETIILASLLEREARSLASKQMVAGILLNRINLGMPLQVDATVQYARDSLDTPVSYWQPVTKSDLSINSPYNTYLNTGFPPGPICNPGYDSLFAAYHPLDSNYIYYITDTDNLMHYATTLAEHNQNIVKYLK